MLQIPHLPPDFARLLDRLRAAGERWLLQAIEVRLTRMAQSPPAAGRAVRAQGAAEGHLLRVGSAMTATSVWIAVVIDRTQGTLLPEDGRILAGGPAGDAQIQTELIKLLERRLTP